MKLLPLIIAVLLVGCAHPGSVPASDYDGLIFSRPDQRIIWNGRRYNSRDCSVAGYSCLTSEVFDLVLPTNCPVATLHSGWSYNGIRFEMVSEGSGGNDPHIGAGYSLYAYRPSTKPNTLIWVTYNAPQPGLRGTAYISQVGRSSLSAIAHPEEPASGRPSDWHRLTSGPPVFQCATN